MFVNEFAKEPLHASSMGMRQYLNDNHGEYVSWVTKAINTTIDTLSGALSALNEQEGYGTDFQDEEDNFRYEQYAQEVASRYSDKKTKEKHRRLQRNQIDEPLPEIKDEETPLSQWEAEFIPVIQQRLAALHKDCTDAEFPKPVLQIIKAYEQDLDNISGEELQRYLRQELSVFLKELKELPKARTYAYYE